jgi:pimeloyl-ACP methyl ester carboxylesterase
MSGAGALAPTSDPEPTLIERPWGRLSFVDEGPRQAPALIAIHGIPGSSRDFRYLAPLLSDDVRLVRIDLPGFGGSSLVREAIASVEGRVRVVIELADQLGLARFALLGHSMGGATALLGAASRPDRVDLIVLVASVAISRHRGLELAPRAFSLLGRLLALPGVGRLLLPRLRREYRRRGLPGADALSAAELSLQLRAIGALSFPSLRRAVRGPLPSALVAYAHDDPFIERRIPEELVAALGDARALAFADGGHNIQKTRAAELAAAIRAALRERTLRAAASGRSEDA